MIILELMANIINSHKCKLMYLDGIFSVLLSVCRWGLKKSYLAHNYSIEHLTISVYLHDKDG